jgi:putative intracellular protease/amidase
MARVLIPLPDQDYELSEVAVPWRELTSRGHEVVFATENGARAKVDPYLVTGVVFGQLGAEPDALEAWRAMEASPEFARPMAWGAIDVARFDALVLPGGHAPGMKQYLGGELLQKKVAEFWALGRPVGAICHGPLVLARAKDPRTGKSLLAGRRTTSLPKYLERTAFLTTCWKLGRYYRTYPAYVEDEIRAALEGGSYVRGPITLFAKGTRENDRGAFVVEDGNYVSARWPGDAWLFAKKIAERLGAEQRATG